MDGISALQCACERKKKTRRHESIFKYIYISLHYSLNILFKKAPICTLIINDWKLDPPSHHEPRPIPKNKIKMESSLSPIRVQVVHKGGGGQVMR
jgi:hypothetical protein